MTGDELTTQAMMAVPVVHAIDYAKAKGWINGASAGRISLWVSIASAFLVAVGVHIHFSGSLKEGGEFSGSFPPLDIMIGGAQHFLASFGSQQAYFTLRQVVGLGKGIYEMQKSIEKSVSNGTPKA